MREAGREKRERGREVTVSVGAITLEREEESRMRRVGGSDNEIESKRERGDNKIQHLFLLFLTKALTNSALQNMPTHVTKNLLHFSLKLSMHTFSSTLMIYDNPTSVF